jgi:site-specific DNA-methyltransferase (adenine-specific)
MTETDFTNTLYTNDNLFILNGLNSDLVDLIYLDPPFNSKRTYSAPVGSKAAGSSFKDMWTWQDVNEAYLETLAANYPNLTKYITSIGGIHSKAMSAYLTYMAQRVIEMHRVLKDTGSLYLHCDPTASHYLKVLLDEVFGKNNFRNEIIWHYRTGGVSKKWFAKKHDVIMAYTKTNNYTFNAQQMKQYYDKKPSFEDKNGGYDEKGYYNIVAQDDVFEIPAVFNLSKERTGYPTQKPLALLQRIINASSNEGDIVFDPFCGCATTCVAAQQLGRQWLGIDIEKQAVQILIDRLSDDAGMFKDFVATQLIPQRTDIVIELPNQSIKERLYKQQNGKCNGCGNEYLIKDMEIDHIIPKAKGGGDYYENYQLLCASCNRIKRVRPMEFLRQLIKTREAMMENQLIFGE